MIILEDLSPDERRKLLEEQDRIDQKRKELLAFFENKVGSYKYRCEQTVANKIDNRISSHAETKREFAVSLSVEHNRPIVRAKMLESITNVNPVQLKEVMDIISEIDTIKSDATLVLDLSSGKIIDVLNLEQINQKWFELKSSIRSRYGITADAGLRAKIDQFLNLAETPLANKKSFIEDLSSKMFFDVFFDKFLMSPDFLVENSSKTFYSYLFDQKPFNVSIKGRKLARTEFSKSAYQCNTEWKMDTVYKLYDQKYKPMIGYNFSEYDFSFDQQMFFDEKGMPEKINTQVVEKVKNNIEIYIDYKLFRIED